MIKSINNIKSKGFTIVELLVVIVVIGILAAITIVSYTGVTQKAKSSAAASNASSVLAAGEAYAADSTKTGFPVTGTALKTSTYSKLPEGLTLQAANPTSSNEATVLGVKVVTAVESTNTGMCVTYYDWSASPAGVKTLYGGTATAATCTTAMTAY